MSAARAVSAVSDFRSDTVTRPTAAMRAAMAEAPVGDDVLDGDPTVRALEDRAAQWLGKEGALYVPSGTMANQVAVGAQCAPGDQLILERSSHIVCWEAGAAAANHGVQTRTLRAPDGCLPLAEVADLIGPTMIHHPPTSLLAVEQSFTGLGDAAGGRVIPLEHLTELREFAGARGIRVHMDGARLAHVVVATGIEAPRWTATADSVSLCLSKGLGAPVGSMVAGDAEFIERAKLVRKRLGGWMRQAGVIAAGGLFALEHNVERLAEDHALARAAAEVLNRRPGIECPPDEVQTNVVMARLTGSERDAVALARALDEQGVRVVPWAPETLRIVTHMDVGPADVERLEAALATVT